MSPKERLLAAIMGKDADRIPWSPFLAYYWEAAPKEVQDKGQLKFLEEIGADPLFRGSHALFEAFRNKCQIRETLNGNEKLVVYETPIGTLQEKYVFSSAGNTWFLMEHPVKTEEDFKILTFINENTQVKPNFSTYIANKKELGDRGLYVPIIGSEYKTSFQSLVEHWVGTEELVYALADYPETVEACLYAMNRNSLDTVKISRESSAEAFLFWEDSSTTNISPTYFEKYTAPEINAWGKLIHEADKYLIHHACGHLRGLLPLMAKTEIDMIESISPPPTGNIELWEARTLLPEHIGLVGGIEPTVFLHSNLEQLEEYVNNLVQRMKGKRYILANSDSCPPGVTEEKFRLVTKLVKNIK